MLGTVPQDPLRMCLVVVWLLGKGRAAGTRGKIRGRRHGWKIEVKRAQGDKRGTERKEEASVAA